MALMSDAISHAILLGIVLAFFVTHDLNSPLLVIAAAATGVLTVSLTEMLTKTRLVKEDASIGLVFPALFSIGVILISRFAGNVHLDVDAVLLGELAFAPFERFEIFGIDLAPKALALMSVILVLNVIFIVAFYKELKLATFDAGLSAALGFAPGLVHYALMSLVSVTAVGAFEAVGSILVVALMIAPPATAYLLTDRLGLMVGISLVAGVVSAVAGYWLSHLLDASIAGSMATMAGIVFAVTYFLAPENGLVAIMRRRARQKWDFAITMLAIHLLHHEQGPEESVENTVGHLMEHLRWEDEFARRVVRVADNRGFVRQERNVLQLTDHGRAAAQEAMTR
jgi:manganese/zinc/iron transport system permease protein